MPIIMNKVAFRFPFVQSLRNALNTKDFLSPLSGA
jgi:hypothetical protein